MPITGREVGPTRICQIAHITGPNPEQLSPSQNTHNLEETTYIALTGCMKQLCDIATYADEIFGGIFDITKKTVDRTTKLHKQVVSLNKRLQGDDRVELDDITPNVQGPERIEKEQALLHRYSRPKAIKSRYESSDSAPALNQFAELHTDSDVQAHLLYSDPSLFVNAWLEHMDKEAEKFKKARKRSFKKSSSRQIKIAAVKKKVHDPKSKTWTMVDVAPQYATLPARGVNSPPQNLPLSSTLNRKKYGIPEDSVTSPTLTDRSSTYSSPVRQSSFDNNYRSCSTPIVSPQLLGVQSPTDTSGAPNILITPDGEPPPPSPPPEYDELPLPGLENMPLPPDDLPPPPDLPSPTVVDRTPPPFSPPPVPDEVIKPPPVSFKQRVLRTNTVVESQSRDTLLDLIRSSSFNLKPISLKPAAARAPEPTYATYQGTDVASILQRRKYLMGVDMNDSDYSDSGGESDGGGWD